MIAYNPQTTHYQGPEAPRTLFVEGPFGAGKTSLAIQTLLSWLAEGIPPAQMLILVPQRSLARRYLAALESPQAGAGGSVSIRTLGGLAQDACELYWPLVAAEAGFNQPHLPPRFLTIETSQYAMGRFVEQAINQGEFEAVSVAPAQIARQIVDNLGKAAIIGIDYRQVPLLLTEALGPERPRKQALAYTSAGRVAEAFRAYCLENRLLDYSLQVELFTRLLKRPDFAAGFYGGVTHLIAEHLEEEPTLSHDLIRAWLPRLAAGLLIYEWEGGYRVFVGAEPQGAERLRDACDGVLRLGDSLVNSPPVDALRQEVAHSFYPQDIPRPTDPALAAQGFEYAYHSYFPQMLDWAAEHIYRLVHDQGVPPSQIAVLVPFLGDALRFSLEQKLARYGIETISHRPSRALKDEPAARCLLTLTALAHPQWFGVGPVDLRLPHQEEVAAALQSAIDGLDPLRARLLTKIVYRPRAQQPLTPFNRIAPHMQARITYGHGQRYEALRDWLAAYAAERDPDPLDHFLSRLFGEVLSQPGYGFHGPGAGDAGRAAAELVESAAKFRQTLYDEGANLNEIGRRYFSIVQQGLLAALYLTSWRDEQTDAVLLLPAYTFLMRGRAVRYQFWLDAGAVGWWERLNQPLTHPYVLSASWYAERRGQPWTDEDEYLTQQRVLYRIMIGLLRRCQHKVYLGISDLGEQGTEQRGPMLRILQQVLRRVRAVG